MSGVNARAATDSASPNPEDLIRLARSAAVGDLVPGLVHELNNPLLAVLGIVDLLLAEADPAAASHRRLGVVRETAVEMRSLLRAIRDFANGVAGPDGRVDVGAAAMETVALVRRTSSAADVELAVDTPPEPVAATGSRAEIRQALLHLLTNGIAAVGNQGMVTVSVARRTASIAVTIADSGPGVPEGLDGLIFEPFFTTWPSRAGLGLAATRAIAERHGGSVDLAAGGDRGAAFVLTLPAAEPGPAE